MKYVYIKYEGRAKADEALVIIKKRAPSLFLASFMDQRDNILSFEAANGESAVEIEALVSETAGVIIKEDVLPDLNKED